VILPLSACHSASAHRLSLISDNRLMSYGKKNDFQDGGWRHLEFQKFQFFGLVTAIGFNICCSIPDDFSQRHGDNFSLKYADLTIFQNGGLCHLGFYTLAFFGLAALVSMPFCFLIQNFAQIGQSLDE